jgi:hypothetical protein
MEDVRPSGQDFADKLAMPLCSAVTWSIVTLLFPGMDDLEGTCLLVSLGVFWLASVYILIAHRNHMSRLDWAFVKYGVLITYLATYMEFRVVALFAK